MIVLVVYGLIGLRENLEFGMEFAIIVVVIMAFVLLVFISGAMLADAKWQVKMRVTLILFSIGFVLCLLGLFLRIIIF